MMEYNIDMLFRELTFSSRPLFLNQCKTFHIILKKNSYNKLYKYAGIHAYVNSNLNILFKVYFAKMGKLYH